MAGEYDLNLSNGSILTTVYPLEVSGPDNLSTPRFIQLIDTGSNTFTLSGDLTSRFVAGFQFNVINSAGGLNDGTYTVAPGGSTFAAGQTTIPVTTSIIGNALPLGEIQYVVLDPRTTLSLPGRGVPNYGEYLVDNFVHILENFAADTPPDSNPNVGTSPAGEALTGQLWYNTTAGEEGYKHYDGTNWTSDVDVDSGSLIFRDVEDGNKDIYLSASESEIPIAPWSGSPALSGEPGFVVWQESDPASEEANFRVLSSDGTEELRVEHDGRTEIGGALYVKNSSTFGNKNIFEGNVGIGGGAFSGTTDKTLTVEGDGIRVNSELATDATLELNAPTGMTSRVDFMSSTGSPLVSTIVANISVTDTNSVLELNSDVSNDVVFVTGGGSVGINQSSPSARLDVVGTSEFNGDVFVIASDIVFNATYGVETVSGSSIKSDATGKTWQVTPFDNTAPVFIVNDSLSSPIIHVSETTGTQIQQHDFIVDSDTLYVDVSNDRVGVNVIPSYPFDVSGDSHIAGRVGINMAPPVTNVPVGTDIWLAVTGDIQANSQFLGSDGASGDPTYSFTNEVDSGMFLSSSNEVGFSVGGTDKLLMGLTRIESSVDVHGTSFMFTGDTNTGITHVGADQLALTTGGVNRLSVGSGGSLSVAGTSNYETLVADDDSIPNKKYVDDTVSAGVASSSWREPVTVQDDTLYASSSAFPTSGTIDGVVLSTGDRVLFTNVTDPADEDVWVWNGTSWDADTFHTRSTGDMVYVEQGTNSGKTYAYDDTADWNVKSYNVGTGAGELVQRDGSGNNNADLLNSQLPSYYLDWTNTTNKPDPTITLGGDLTGSITLTDLAGGTLTATVVDDSHNHIIGNVDGLQTALNDKLDASTYTAADVLSKLLTVDGTGSGLDADTIDGVNSTQLFLNTGGSISGNVDMQNNKISNVELETYSETVVTASSGSSYLINCSTAHVFDITLTANCTFSFTNPAAAGKSTSFTLILTQDGAGSRAVVWPGSVVWAGGTAPTISATGGDVDVLTFFTIDNGTTWFGFESGLTFS